jgi:hypothetical protein
MPMFRPYQIALGVLALAASSLASAEGPQPQPRNCYHVRGIFGEWNSVPIEQLQCEGESIALWPKGELKFANYAPFVKGSIKFDDPRDSWALRYFYNLPGNKMDLAHGRLVLHDGLRDAGKQALKRPSLFARFFGLADDNQWMGTETKAGEMVMMCEKKAWNLQDRVTELRNKLAAEGVTEKNAYVPDSLKKAQAVFEQPSDLPYSISAWVNGELPNPTVLRAVKLGGYHDIEVRIRLVDPAEE